MYKVLVTDGLEKGAVDNLKALGVEVVEQHYAQDVLGETLKEYDALVVRSATKVTKDVVDVAKTGKLKLVIRGGVGVDNIEVKYAEENGIKVRNTPNASSASVAELVIAHIFAVARFVNTSNVTMRNGEWNKKKYVGVEIAGKTIGIVGMGRIGRELAKRADALGMTVIYNDLMGKQDALNYEFVELNEIYKRADFISLHVPYDKNAGSLIGKEQFEMMKDGVYLINCARGKVVDEEALIEALNSGKVAGAGVDVFEQEPTANEALVNHPCVSVTPHIGASTKEAQTKIGEEIVSIIKENFNL